MSMRQRPCAGSRGTTSTWPDRILGISGTLGQIGPPTTTRSPGETTSWAASIRALTPALVMARRFSAIGAPCRSLR